MSSEFIRCILQPDGYAELIIDRPDARNALCRSLTDSMTAHLNRLAADAAVRAAPNACRAWWAWPRLWICC
ncbi:hypothetical protein [Pseudothauera hydrothermalis]|uniref:hypothetical protein n=1 Tax=Pseudothauera hydrothermalis TaxID=2184083 RepID=UPI001F22E00F|nr:hypothetical protein [Pseudothauera hydrothermalis]